MDPRRPPQTHFQTYGQTQSQPPLRQKVQRQQVNAPEFDEARETLDIMFEMSQILNCGIDQHTLSILAQLVENGVNPEALAAVVKELKRESDALKAASGQ